MGQNSNVTLDFVVASDDELRSNKILRDLPADGVIPEGFHVISNNANKRVWCILGSVASGTEPVLKGLPMTLWKTFNTNNNKSPKQLFDEFDKRYASTGDASKQELLDRLGAIRITKDDEATSQFGLFDALINELATRGRIVSEEEKYNYILNMVRNNSEYTITLDTYDSINATEGKTVAVPRLDVPRTSPEVPRAVPGYTTSGSG